IPDEFKADSLWKMTAYRLGLFLGDVGWQDVTKLLRDRRTIALSDQLYRAVGSISANLAEGYSRGTGVDRARFYEYALGSARESRDWYFKGRHILGLAVFQHRLKLLSEIIALLLTMIPQQRARTLKEELETPRYMFEKDETIDNTSHPGSLQELLRNVPLPDR
ncbi:MAG: four helix bundle protein, partial [Roseiflexaceae bacterium]